MRSDELPIERIACCDDRDSGGRPDRWLGVEDLKMLPCTGGVDGSAQFPSAQHSLAPNLPATLVSKTGKMGFSSYGGAIWSDRIEISS